MIPLRDRRKSLVPPIVTTTLILINIVVFVFQLTLSDNPDAKGAITVKLAPWRKHNITLGNYSRLKGYQQVVLSPKQAFLFRFGVIPGEIADFTDLPPRVPLSIFVTIITSTFIHGGILHILGNMLFLWIFGDNVEEAMGHIRFLLFYFISAAGAVLFQVLASLNSGVPMIGASGAIAGVMASYFILFPTSRILTIVPIFFFFTFIEIPAGIVLGLWFIFQLLRAPMGTAGGVAVLAHVGGFLTGAILTPYLKRPEFRMKLFDLW